MYCTYVINIIFKHINNKELLLYLLFLPKFLKLIMANNYTYSGSLMQYIVACIQRRVQNIYEKELKIIFFCIIKMGKRFNFTDHLMERV